MKRMMIVAGVLALGLGALGAAEAADTCSLSGAYVAGTVYYAEPVLVRFDFTPPADCSDAGEVAVSAVGYTGTSGLLYRVGEDGTLSIRLPLLGVLVLRGETGAGGFSFEGSGLVGTAIAAAK